MTKVVINNSYGGYGLSRKAIDWLYNNYNLDFPEDSDPLPRHDSRLVECVETLGDEASGEFAKLVVRTINSDKYRICEYDGGEWVETPESIDWISVN